MQRTVDTNDLVDLKFLLRETRTYVSKMERQLQLAYEDRFYADRRWGSILSDMRKEIGRYACECTECVCKEENEYCGWRAKEISEGK
jgi:hypothetical protein